MIESRADPYEAARLRWATPRDADALRRLWAEAHDVGDDEPAAAGSDMDAWLAHGGAALIEDAAGRPLCAVRWREQGDGWRVDRIATLPEARGRAYGRWLMTKLEALAIQRNVPTLSLTLVEPGPDLEPYYERLGYRAQDEHDRPADGPRTVEMSKRVGGVWQRQPGSRP